MTLINAFWCDNCEDWTAVDEEEYQRVLDKSGEGDVICKECGHSFHCQECGFEIDREGNCLRNESGPADTVGRCPEGA